MTDEERRERQRQRREKNRERWIAYSRAYYQQNKARHNARSKAYYESNKDRYCAWAKDRYQAMTPEDRKRKKVRERELHRLRRYGVTQEIFDRLFASQGKRCAICRDDKPGWRADWHLDHDHETGVVRGILCVRCNIGVGGLRDNPQIVMDAATYLLKHKAKLRAV